MRSDNQQEAGHLSPSLLTACNWLSWQPCHPPCRIAEPVTSHMHLGRGRFSNTFQENMLKRGIYRHTCNQTLSVPK